ncbi:hypothetical protein BDP55DRAFT_735550 [Colletotrichum godetiae]|uniref:Uncharacterized protein n=1 Tax=Colletotrichum godetiae TaxID=1209918 RepID=A0AAJ0ELR5_9PEZI|nr:uncharacterized protein BDP55DRAFT_735550 [Colletotrichum godetiae]KAK1656626.1 hypothetical protein BDP55DRAFT_735550 [Colletotrichum godetiae]
MISKVIIALHVILTLVILALTVRILQDEQNEESGIVQILLRKEARRFVQVPDVVGSIATAVKSAASSVVTAAVASGESLVAASLPSRVSVGTIAAGFAVSLYKTAEAVADLLGVEASRGDVFEASLADFVASLIMTALVLVEIIL